MLRFIEQYIKIVSENADRIALDDGKEAVTYRELDELSSRVYAYLKQNSIGKEDFVMIDLPRGVHTVAAMLGVIKAGAAFVPLESSYPRERAAFIKEDAGCCLVLTEELMKEVYETAPLSGYEETGLHDAAYVIYTSGSTGNPKGVIHEYGNVDQAMILSEKDLKLENLGLVAPFYFVATILLLINSIVCRNTMHIISHEMVRNFNKMKAFIIDKKLKVIFLPPSYIRLYTDPSPYLEMIFTGSEPANGLYYEGGKPRIVNIYSLSEAGFRVLECELDKVYDVAPVGKPLLDIPFYLYDEDGQVIEGPGQGEICFVNEYVRGYINLPEKTKEAWRDGIYHTGDIGRRDEEGRYYIVGRIDDMIKINGNRIEPAEIETKVQGLTGLRKVIAKGFTLDEDRAFVCVYYIRTEAEKLGILKDGTLQINKEKLKKLLPDYMIPAYYVALDSFPLNANGKIAKKELKCPDVSDYKTEYVEPANKLEAYFSEKMAKVLKRARFSAADDFFAMGGSSIKAITFVSECEEYPVTSELLYEYPTPQLLAAHYTEGAVSSQRNTAGIRKECREILLAQAEKKRAEYEKKGETIFFSNSYFSINKKVLSDPRLASCQQYVLKEEIDRARLYDAVNRAANKYPYVKMSIQAIPGDMLCTFRDEKRPIPVFPMEEEVMLGSEKNNAHQVLIKYAGNELFIYVSHVLTDGNGMNRFIQSILGHYFGCENEAADPMSIQPDYFVDLMESTLPVSEGYKAIDRHVPGCFTIPERDSENLCCRSETVFADRVRVEAFCKKNGVSVQIAAILMIMEVIRRVHPENERPIISRCPVDTRDMFGIPNAFSNASIPHIFFTMEPESLKEKRFSELAKELRSQFEEQYDYDNFVYFINRMAHRVKGADDATIMEDRAWYKGHSQILVSDLGETVSGAIAEKIERVQTETAAAAYPFMVYVSQIGDRTCFQIISDFESGDYVSAFRDILSSRLE